MKEDRANMVEWTKRIVCPAVSLSLGLSAAVTINFLAGSSRAKLRAAITRIRPRNAIRTK